MNLRLITLLVAFLALPASSQAADEPAAAALAARAAVLQTVARGATVTSNQQQYQVLAGARAVESQQQEQPQDAITRAGGGKLIETKGAFVVFAAGQRHAPVVASTNNATTYPTVINTRTGVVGVLPGTLKVKPKNMANAQAIAADHGLVLVRAFAHLQTAFYRVNVGQDVVAAAAALAADPRVASAEVEVIEHVRIPQ